MTIEEMRGRKTEFGLTNEMIAKESGVPLGTVQKIFSGQTKSPRKLTIEAIESLLLRIVKEKRAEDHYYPSSSNVLRESSAEYLAVPKRGPYTEEDYYALPEGERVELIDGFFYDMKAAPSLSHQMIVGELYLLFRRCTDVHSPECEVYLSPCDVRLDRDKYTIVQPDILIICGKYDYAAHGIEGAPDLVVEVLSPSTRSKDMLLKSFKYQNAGVREYWIVDPKYKKVTVHLFKEEDYDPKTYDFHSQVPVGISKGRCSIDFSGILKKMEAHGW